MDGTGVGSGPSQIVEVYTFFPFAFEAWLEETTEESLKRFWNDDGVILNAVDADKYGLQFAHVA